MTKKTQRTGRAQTTQLCRSSPLGCLAESSRSRRVSAESSRCTVAIHRLLSIRGSITSDHSAEQFRNGRERRTGGLVDARWRE